LHKRTKELLENPQRLRDLAWSPIFSDGIAGLGRVGRGAWSSPVNIRYRLYLALLMPSANMPCVRRALLPCASCCWWLLQRDPGWCWSVATYYCVLSSRILLYISSLEIGSSQLPSCFWLPGDDVVGVVNGDQQRFLDRPSWILGFPRACFFLYTTSLTSSAIGATDPSMTTPASFLSGLGGTRLLMGLLGISYAPFVKPQTGGPYPFAWWWQCRSRDGGIYIAYEVAVRSRTWLCYFNFFGDLFAKWKEAFYFPLHFNPSSNGVTLLFN
jgi:hypothetical protein